MRAAGVALASLATQMVNAQVIITTKNECWKGEGGKFVDNCSDVYFLTCDNYEIYKDSACNVFVFSDSRVTWIPEQIKVNTWAYYYREGTEDKEATATADMFGESEKDGTVCFPGKEIPTVYKNGAVNNFTDGMCGYKYQLTNEDKVHSNKFKVLKDRASMLVASSLALGLATMLAF